MADLGIGYLLISDILFPAVDGSPHMAAPVSGNVKAALSSVVGTVFSFLSRDLSQSPNCVKCI